MDAGRSPGQRGTSRDIAGHKKSGLRLDTPKADAKMTRMETNIAYVLRLHCGATFLLAANNYADAVAEVALTLDGCVIGHPGDLSDGGDRTLVWDSEDDAAGDDGAHAIGALLRRSR